MNAVLMPSLASCNRVLQKRKTNHQREAAIGANMMCWLGLARKPWPGPGFIWLGLHESQARAQARKSGLAWPGPGLSHGFNRDRRRQRGIIFIGWHSDYFPASHTHLRDKKMKLWLAWPGLAWEISGQKPKPAQARAYGPDAVVEVDAMNNHGNAIVRTALLCQMRGCLRADDRSRPQSWAAGFVEAARNSEVETTSALSTQNNARALVFAKGRSISRDQ
ncbi:hypothetical protein DFH07DRAFT_937993 [Mycena maculata]|uniref:Uncharacterized protein n=1 Tax=Mycena maculata TaxID=230809 RepID=A0AAD7NQ93_9AGAR|nr:hypothetical protein DFH07DRAFT_937993 [Mycena maculata]